MPLSVGTSKEKVVMTVEKGERPNSPVHVHVDDATPVHVHVKKPAKAKGGALSSVKTHEGRQAESKAKSFGSSNLRRSTATVRSRSKSPTREAGGPWVPPPGKTSKGQKYAWTGGSHRLEISTPAEAEVIQGTLHMSDLSTDEEANVHVNMRTYERKIDNLMNEVGSLKSKVVLQRTAAQREEKDAVLSASRRALEEQELELQDYRRELEATEAENSLLRKDMERLRDETHNTSRSERDQFGIMREHLMKKLVEVEMDGQAASKQVAALRDTIRRLREEKRISSSDSAMLAKQKELLMERLADFEATNRALRSMLQERHEEEAAGMRLSEQRDLLLKKLSESEDGTQRLRAAVLDKDRQIADLRLQLEAQREENMATSSMQTSLEATRGHLQKQLRQKEADCNRMAVQIRSMETQLAQEKIEVDHLQELLNAAKDKAERDKEALKKATRAQKDRCGRSDSVITDLNSRLADNESHQVVLVSQFDKLRLDCDLLTKENAQALAENAALKASQKVETERSQSTIDHLNAQVSDYTKDIAQLSAQIEKLQLQCEKHAEEKTKICAEKETFVITHKDDYEKYQNTITDLNAQIKEAREREEKLQLRTDKMHSEFDRLKEEKVKACAENAIYVEVQKQRANRSEDALDQLNAQILERDTHLAEYRAELENMRSHADKLAKEKAQTQAEKDAMQMRVTELENIMHRVEDTNKQQIDTVQAKLHEKTSEAAATKLENERLKTSISTIEDKLTQAESEVTQLRSNLRQYETLVDEYRTQMNRSRREADESMIQLEEQKRETGKVQRDSEAEIEKVKTRLQSRLKELEPIPELLKSTELKLHDANEKVVSHEKKNMENTKLIAELTTKVEHQSEQLDTVRTKYHGVQEDNRGLGAKMDVLERKLTHVEEQNRDLLSTVAKREDAVHTTNSRLDEKTRECASLQRQLEAALADSRRVTEQSRDKACSKERATQTRILDLESQLSQARAEMARLKREKEESERKFNSRLYDLKDRLEQSHSTNRSMQNYVQFLKNSYANVFGDSSAMPGAGAGASPLRGGPYPF